MNLYLIGYRGSGKTRVAAELGKLLGWPWLDADVEIERRTGKSIKEIFAATGETGFRDVETAVVTDWSKVSGHVLALGGGAVLREENRQALRASGKVVWLQASPEILFERIRGDASTVDRRPNLTAGGGLEEVRQLLAVRTPAYASCADWSLDSTAKSPAELARQIADWLQTTPRGV